MFSNSSAGATYIVDLQTRKTYEDVGGKKNTAKMGVSFAALLNHDTNDISVHTEKDVNTLLDRIFSSRLIVGLNLKKFIYPVLSGYHNANFERIKSLDILEYLRKKIIRKPTSDELFWGTLGINLTIDHNKIARLFKEDKFQEIKQITIDNVQALNSVYSFGRQKGHVFISDQTGQRWKISVIW
jgi:hypothetical protein